MKIEGLGRKSDEEGKNKRPIIVGSLSFIQLKGVFLEVTLIFFFFFYFSI